jgi:hypothetical protein
MKNTIIKTTRLADDIRQIFVNAYGTNHEMIRLCRDHPDPLLYSDKKPVLNITQDEFVGIFNVSLNHYFLPAVQVLRLGIYCSLPLPNLIALIMKSEWESYLSGMSGILNTSGSNLTGQDLIDRYISGFKPNPGNILNLIRNANDGSSYRIVYGEVEFIISDLMEKSRFLIANDQVSKLYSKMEISEEILLQNISETQKESYLRLKGLWLIKSTELDDLLMYLERKKRLNLGLENKYFRIFGSLEAEKSKYSYRLEKYMIIMEIMHKNPEFSFRELISSAEDRLTKAKREQSDLKNKITRSQNHIENLIIDSSQPAVSDEFRNSYMQECKKLLRKLFFLLHTDTCPNYSGLKGQKKAEINKLWLKLMKSTKEEMYSFSPSMLLYSLPDYEQLKSIYERACTILGLDPECYETGNRLEFMIRKGASIESIMNFLKIETEQLELHLARLELIQNEYTHEDQTRSYRDAMENINGHTERLKCNISDLKKQIRELKKQITNEYIIVAR